LISTITFREIILLNKLYNKVYNQEIERAKKYYKKRAKKETNLNLKCNKWLVEEKEEQKKIINSCVFLWY